MGADQPFMASSSLTSTPPRLRADAHLGGGDGDDEEGEDLARHGAGHRPEGDQVDVDGVEDELDGHEHHHAVAARQHPVDADAEQGGTQQQELVEEQAVVH
jgi:hypothetical protein